MLKTVKKLLKVTRTATGSLIADHLNKAGERYLDSINDTRPESTVAMMERLSPLLMHVKDGATLVSVGVGQGEEICGLYELFGTKISIVGIDISDIALEKTAARLARNQFEAKLINANASELPLADETVDAVILSSTLHEVFSYHNDGLGAFRNAVKEAGRVLKKDGVIFVRDFAAPEKNTMVSFRVRSPIALKFYEYFRNNFRHFLTWGDSMNSSKIGTDFLPSIGHGIVHIPFSKAAEVVLHFRSFWSDYQSGQTTIGNTDWKEIDEVYLVGDKNGVFTPERYMETLQDILGDQFKLIYRRIRNREKTNVFLVKHFSIFDIERTELLPETTRKLECIFQKNPTVEKHYAAAVIFDRDERILLCRRSMSKKIAPGMWHLPGGTIEFDESPIEAVSRELDEELGLQTINALPTGATISYERNGSVHRTHILWVEVENEPTLKNPENDLFEFVAYSAIEKYLEPQVLKDNQNAILLARRVRDTGVIAV